MQIEQIYEELDRTSLKEQQRRLFAAFLGDQLDQRRRHPERSQELAYEIAGLLSTKFASSLDETDPYLDILTMAGQLELPQQHHGTASWEALEERVALLPE